MQWAAVVWLQTERCNAYSLAPYVAWETDIHTYTSERAMLKSGTSRVEPYCSFMPHLGRNSNPGLSRPRADPRSAPRRSPLLRRE